MKLKEIATRVKPDPMASSYFIKGRTIQSKTIRWRKIDTFKIESHVSHYSIEWQNRYTIFFKPDNSINSLKDCCLTDDNKNPPHLKWILPLLQCY